MVSSRAQLCSLSSCCFYHASTLLTLSSHAVSFPPVSPSTSQFERLCCALITFEEHSYQHYEVGNIRQLFCFLPFCEEKPFKCSVSLQALVSVIGVEAFLASSVEVERLSFFIRNPDEKWQKHGFMSLCCSLFPLLYCVSSLPHSSPAALESCDCCVKDFIIVFTKIRTVH